MRHARHSANHHPFLCTHRCGIRVGAKGMDRRRNGATAQQLCAVRGFALHAVQIQLGAQHQHVVEGSFLAHLRGRGGPVADGAHGH